MRWFFHSLHPIQDIRKDINFFHVVQIFTELGEFTHLAHKENTESDIFLWDRRKILLHFLGL
jgi:hypothetical protein